MEKKTLKALQGSIRKWDGIVEGIIRDKGTKNCPLCTLFYDSNIATDTNCLGCPVATRTGEPMCFDTPYYGFPGLSNAGWAESKEAKSAARAEHKFLVELLPEGIKPETYREKKSDNSSPVSNADPDTLQDRVHSGGAG